MTVDVMIISFSYRLVSLVDGEYNTCSEDYTVVSFGPRNILVMSHHS